MQKGGQVFSAVVDLLRGVAAKQKHLQQEKAKLDATVRKRPLDEDDELSDDALLAFADPVTFYPASASTVLPWGWVCREVCDLFSRYSTGITESIILCEIFQKWEKLQESILCSIRGEIPCLALDAVLNFGELESTDVLELSIGQVDWFSAKRQGSSMRIPRLQAVDRGSRSTVVYLPRRFSRRATDIDLFSQWTQWINQGTAPETNLTIHCTSCQLVSGASGSTIMVGLAVLLVDAAPLNAFVTKLKTELFDINGVLKRFASAEHVGLSATEIGIPLIIKATIEHVESKNDCILFWLRKVDGFPVKMTCVFQIAGRALAESWQRLLHVDDCIVLEGVSVSKQNSTLVLNYEHRTTVLLTPSATPTQSRSHPQVADKELDVGLAMERITVNQLQHLQRQITLQGFVVSVEMNSPAEDENDVYQRFRFCFRLCDETGWIDITMWHSGAATLQIGQFVVVTDMLAINANGVIRGSCGKSSTIVCVSSLSGPLMSPLFNCASLRTLQELTSSSTDVDWVIVRVTIVTCALYPGHKKFVERVHKLCRRETGILRGRQHCAHCDFDIANDSELMWQYRLRIDLDDGKTLLPALLTGPAASHLLDVDPSRFGSLESDAQRRVIERTISTQRIASIVKVRGATIPYRIENLARVNSGVIVTQMLTK